MLKLDAKMLHLAEQLKDEQSLLVFGRGYNYATALEAALKVGSWAVCYPSRPWHMNEICTCLPRITVLLVGECCITEFCKSLPKQPGVFLSARVSGDCEAQVKEVALMHSEGILAGEMKHGPLALVDERLPIIVVATRDRMRRKMLSVLQQLRARGAQLIVLCNEGDSDIQDLCGKGCRLIQARAPTAQCRAHVLPTLLLPAVTVSVGYFSPGKRMRCSSSRARPCGAGAGGGGVPAAHHQHCAAAAAVLPPHRSARLQCGPAAQPCQVCDCERGALG